MAFLVSLNADVGNCKSQYASISDPEVADFDFDLPGAAR